MRLFVAIELPMELKQQIGARVESVRQQLPVASWGKAETYHVTLAFIGDQPESIVTAIAAQLQASVREARFGVEIKGAGFFPNARRARVAWIGLSPADRLAALATEVREGLRRVHVAFDEKPFKPHLTLARLKAPWSETDAALLTKAFDQFDGGFTVREVTLFSSQLSAKGATHRAVAVAKLRS